MLLAASPIGITKKSSKNSQTHVLEFVNIYDNQQSTFNLKNNLSLCMDLSSFWRHFWTRCVFGGLLKKVFVIVFIILVVMLIGMFIKMFNYI